MFSTVVSDRIAAAGRSLSSHGSLSGLFKYTLDLSLALLYSLLIWTFYVQVDSALAFWQTVARWLKETLGSYCCSSPLVQVCQSVSVCDLQTQPFLRPDSRQTQQGVEVFYPCA